MPSDRRRLTLALAGLVVCSILVWSFIPGLSPEPPEPAAVARQGVVATPQPSPRLPPEPETPTPPRPAEAAARNVSTPTTTAEELPGPAPRDAQGRLRWRPPPPKVRRDGYNTNGYDTAVSFDRDRCEGWVVARKTKNCGENRQWSLEGALSDWVRGTFGPEHIRVHVRGPEVVLANVSHLGGCEYGAHFELSMPGEYFLWADVLHENYDAVNELKEKTWYDYVMRPLTSGRPILKCRRQPPAERQAACTGDLRSGATQSQQWGRWVDDGPGGTVEQFKKNFPGYWLSMGKREGRVNDHTPDLLGRLDFRRKYRWEPYRCTHQTYPKERVLELLRNREIFFFGDSHMRMTFYGVLHRLGITFPFDKVWRGDRSDLVESHNARITFVASYFLNVSRPTAVEMLEKLGRTPRGLVVAGVGQHHASGCWTVRKHTGVVKEAIDTFSRQKTPLVWMGVPAHPLNVHMRVVQHRTDCRNNLRHRLLNKVQYELVRSRGHPIVDVFAKSEPMIHTSPDGAHYFGYVRDGWIDDIFAAVELLVKRGTVK
eukprot:Hpha_TRINITY_DN18693_c0_g1::TRINITY_DN18693_c0_g1_i1::g.115586::m.115586